MRRTVATPSPRHVSSAAAHDWEPMMQSVSLRRATPDDAERVLAWREEPSAGHYQPLRPTSAARLRQRFASEAKHPIDPHFIGTATFVIEVRGTPAGWMTL
ncbi:MAG TPA: hypothetical protein VGR08_14820, partial [Thermomicrobiales bacterium]|nr:hypothetical protein [Thermomicrobiales bacterium]